MTETLEEQKITMKPYTREEAMKACLEYFDGNEMQAVVFLNKYALKDSDGNIYECTPDQMHKRLAKELARIEAKHPNPRFDEQGAFDLMSRFRYIVPQGSPMAGIGNDLQYVSLSNCFVIGNDGPSDSYGAIMKTDQEQIQLMKRRGGVGHDLSSIRPKGSPVENSALTSTGVVPFMERFSNSTREVAQDGRRGALMLTISCDHPDVEAFIDAKMDSTKVTGANVSVRISDRFMKAIANGDTEYELRFPTVGEPVYTRTVDPQVLWKKIIHNAWKSAEPGVLFWDTVIRESLPDCYAKKGFASVSVNPCGEIILCPDDSCRLTAINLYSYVKDPFTKKAEFDFDLFRNHTALAMRFMDNIIDLEIEKVERIISKIERDPESQETKQTELNLWKRIADKCRDGRRTGLGITAEGDMLAAMGLTYGTKKATNFAEQVQRELCLAAYRESSVMAKERGAFKHFNFESERNNPFMKRLIEADPKLGESLKEFGRRNIAILTIAPTGSVSIMTDTTSGIEPVFSVSYRRRRKVNPNDKDVKITFVDQVGDSWEEYPVFHKHFETWLKANGKDVPMIKAMADDQEIAMLVAESPYHKATSNDVDWVEKVAMQGKMQKWVDHSISVTVNLPNEVTEELVAQVYMNAWKAGCKGCTVYRDGSRSGVLITNEEKKQKELFGDTAAPKRPKSLECVVTRFTNQGAKWIGFMGLFDGRPYELFTGDVEDFPIPSYVENGHIVKEKKGDKSAYHFVYLDKSGTEIKMPNLNHAFDDSYYDLAKTFSALLRHGMPLPYMVELIDGLNLDGDLINTWKAGVRRMLKKYIKDGTTVSGKTCKDCGSASLEYKEGCMTCSSCGSSKCQ
jgi:ribonucleoside-diphosphate reductase alpha chain